MQKSKNKNKLTGRENRLVVVRGRRWGRGGGKETIIFINYHSSIREEFWIF